MPNELWSATITSNGQLTAPFEYISGMRTALRRESKAVDANHELALQGSTVLALSGHLFDSGLINRVLDLAEEAGANFHILQVSVQGAASRFAHPSDMLLQLTLEEGRPALEAVLDSIRNLGASHPESAFSMAEKDAYCGGVYDATLLRNKEGATGSGGGGAVGQSGGVASANGGLAGSRLVMLGAGMCARPALEYLSRDPTTQVTVVSAIEGEAAALCRALSRPNLTPLTRSASPASASDWADICSLIDAADGALSLLPAPMHVSVAEECIARNTKLVTASYVSPEMQALSARAAEAGVPILCEMGLDPGMDHMSAMRLLAQTKAAGGVITSFSSVCGGLPAPEAADNPLRYKFSWSPAGVMSASENSAKYIRGGEVVDVPGTDLLRSAYPLTEGRLSGVFNLEVIPNRDSLPYAELYNLGEAKDVFRGTLRYAGWGSLMADLRDVGLTDGGCSVPAGDTDWAALSRSLDLHKGSADARACLRWLGAFDASTPVEGVTVRDAWSNLLQRRLEYADGERDAVYMEHQLRVTYPDSERADETLSSSLVSFGNENETMMSRTVGLTASIGLDLLLQKDSELTGGVHTPTKPEVYEFCLDKLAEEGVTFVET